MAVHDRVKVVEGVLPGLTLKDGTLVDGKCIVEWEGDWTWVYIAGGFPGKVLWANLKHHGGSVMKSRTSAEDNLWAVCIKAKLDAGNIKALLSGKTTPGTGKPKNGSAPNVEYNPFHTSNVAAPKVVAPRAAAPAPTKPKANGNPLAVAGYEPPSVVDLGEDMPKVQTLTGAEGKVAKLESQMATMSATLSKMADILVKLTAAKTEQPKAELAKVEEAKPEQAKLVINLDTPVAEPVARPAAYYRYKRNLYRVDGLGRIHHPNGPIVGPDLKAAILKANVVEYYDPAKVKGGVVVK